MEQLMTEQLAQAVDDRCEDLSAILVQATGWMFGKLLHHYFLDVEVVLVEAHPKGGALYLKITSKWLETNDPRKLGVTSERVGEVLQHAKQCPSDCCRKAYAWSVEASPFLADGTLPGGNCKALSSVFRSEFRGLYTPLHRCGGHSEVMDALAPFFQRFEEYHDHWKWDDAEKEVV